MAKLTIESGSERGKQFKLPDSGTFAIGRDEKCAVCIDDIMASRLHCVVRCDSGKWVIEDHKSTNGIRVNDVPVDRHTLIPGDTIAIGDTLLALSATDEDPLIGSTLAGYKVEKRLGRGAMGTVYLARQLSLDRPVALKILAPRFSKDEDFIQRFLEEARAAGRLNHPNVVQVYDAGHEGDHHYMSMEYLEGGSLEELLEREERLDVIRAVEAARDAAQALQFAQQNHIVHRDIKPANLLLTLDGTVKVGDLGIAADLRQYSGGVEATGKTSVAGSPRYMAPEQARGESLDQRADIYGLGATLYKMIAGVAPFDGSSVKEIIKAKMENDPPPLRRLIPEVPGGLSTVVQKMLARNPESRYDNADQVYTALDPSQYRKSISSKAKVRAARSTSSPQGTRPSVSRRGPRRAPQKSQANLVVGAVLGIVALVFGLVLVTKLMDTGGENPGVSRPAEREPTTKTPEKKPERSGLERDPSKVALKERERISTDYSAGRIDAAEALQRLENLLGDNPRIAPSSEELMKKLLAAVEVFVGPEIYSNPTQHVRIKPPEDHLGQDGPIVGEMAQTVWHQDLATIMPEADNSRILTVWIAVSEATRENGCLLVAPGSHKRGLVKHCRDPRSSYSRQAIPDRLVGDRRVALEMDPGDVLFMDKLTMHASLPNLSEDIRWSVDLRYQPGGEPTGRPWFPGFVARSRSAPESVLANAAAWAALWHRARERLAAAAPASFQRWPEGASTAP